MTLQNETVGHKSLTDGSQVTLHSHAGGGSQEIDVGQSIGAKATVVQVDFGFTFSATPRISLTPWSEHIGSIISVSTTMFEWTNNSKNVDVTVDWIAVKV